MSPTVTMPPVHCLRAHNPSHTLMPQVVQADRADTQHQFVQTQLTSALNPTTAHLTHAASAPSTLTISASLLALSAMPVHFCTAIATLSSRWEPMASASLHVQCVLAEWCISPSSRSASALVSSALNDGERSDATITVRCQRRTPAQARAASEPRGPSRSAE